jgi:hypothetical protein
MTIRRDGMSSEGLDIERVRRVAAEVRAFLEPRWDAVHEANEKVPPDGKPPARDMCRLSSAFLQRVLEEEVPGEDWTVVGGDPLPGGDVDPECGTPGGCRDWSKGEWHGHYWVVGGGSGLVVDVTADQFGGEPVLVTEDDSRHRKNYHQDAVEERVREVRWRVSQWMRTRPLLRRWTAIISPCSVSATSNHCEALTSRCSPPGDRSQQSPARIVMTNRPYRVAHP